VVFEVERLRTKVERKASTANENSQQICFWIEIVPMRNL
jgi:hypothetical protein